MFHQVIEISSYVDFEQFKKQSLVPNSTEVFFMVVDILIAELLARAKRAQSGAPWERKFGKLSI